jgi:hypothetical protein
MRNNTRLDLRKILISNVITIIFVLFVIISAHVNAQEKQLIIDVISEVYEEADFLVSVYTITENDTPVYQIDVIIEFNNELYNITAENPEITITAPEITENTFFTIFASKNGYESAVTNISVLKKEHQDVQQLIITLLDDDFIIDAGNQFSVLVTNKTGAPISDVIVGIQSFTGEGAVGNTDVNGRVRLVAPEDRSEIILIAQKEGYIEGTEKIWVHANPSIIDTIIQNPFTPIIIAVLVLVLAILFVNLRQKRTKYPKEKPIEFLKQNNKDQIHHEKNATFNSRKDNGKISYKQIPEEENQLKSNQGAKVEEIRISRPIKTKKIISVGDEEKKKVSYPKGRKKTGDDWFEGTDDIMYEIDKLTGIIDEKRSDKWFEGTDNIRAKIDEKLKMKDKKKGK